MNFFYFILFLSSFAWAQKPSKNEVLPSITCPENIPTINLEEEGGPFFGVPRDNQDGLGTCYANTTKNLIIGLTNGQVNASFLDLAIQYKRRQGGFREGIDIGNVCQTLAAVAETGICPRENSPLETGEVTGLSNLLFPEDSEAGLQASILENLRRFMASRDAARTFTKQNPALSNFEARTSAMVGAIRANPNIRIPLPIVKDIDLAPHTLEKLHSQANRPTEEKETFVAGYRERIERVRPLIVNAVVQGKTRAEILAIHQEHLGSYLQSFGINLPINDLGYQLDQPNLSQIMTDSLSFIQTFTGLNYQDPEQLRTICQSNPLIEYADSLLTLVRQLNENGATPDALFNPDGSLRSNADLMQLAIAPACLNQANRRLLPFTPTCRAIRFNEDQSIEARATRLRENALENLRNRMPVGQLFPQGTGNHINTIVGIRRDAATSQCQYLIRESQTGESTWQNESALASIITELNVAGRP